jgi:hypothetical protein
MDIHNDKAEDIVQHQEPESKHYNDGYEEANSYTISVGQQERVTVCSNWTNVDLEDVPEMQVVNSKSKYPIRFVHNRLQCLMLTPTALIWKRKKVRNLSLLLLIKVKGKRSNNWLGAAGSHIALALGVSYLTGPYEMGGVLAIR